MVKDNKNNKNIKNNKNNNSSNSLVFGGWPQTKIAKTKCENKIVSSAGRIC